MISIRKSALVNYSAQQMYDIVADIDAYPDFLQWCSGSHVLEKNIVNEADSVEVVIARVDIHYKGIQQSFTTKNKNTSPSSISMNLYDRSGPFDKLNGKWVFTNLDGDQKASKIEFHLDFSVTSKLLTKIFEKVFYQIANLQVEGFVKRAEKLYQVAL